MLVSALVGRLVGKLNEPARQLQPGMKGMGQVAAGSTGLIKQGNILISEKESLPKQNLLPWCLPADSA